MGQRQPFRHAITGGIFASGFINATTTLTASTYTTNFADVAANNTVPGWNAWGFFKGSITGGDIFSVDTLLPTTPATW